MKRRFVVALLVLSIPSAAWSAPQEKRKGLRERLLKRFDKDGNGKLSETERAAARKYFQDRRKTTGDQRSAQSVTVKLGDVERTALVYLPSEKQEQPAPLVFGFHGHGGNSRNAARSFRMHQLWPEAVVVYMQGIPTPGRLTDPDGKRNGWQHAIGEHGDRDLKFFDKLLAMVKTKYKVDERRIYSMGHSNGGGFTYLLWAARPQVFAAVAPSSAGSRALRTKTPQPIPVMHIAGEKDQLVKFRWQQATIQQVSKINRCGSEGRSWKKAKGATLYKSTDGADLVTLIHPGTHKFYREAPPLIVQFFKQHKRGTSGEDKPRKNENKNK